LYRIQHQPPDLAGCPAQVRPLLEWCLAKDPADRPAPAGVIEACQEGAAVRTIEYPDTWLPLAMTADLPAHAAPVRGLHGISTETPVTAGQAHGPAGPIGAGAADPASARRPGRLLLRWVAPAVAGTLIAGGLAGWALSAGGGNAGPAADHRDSVSTAAARHHHRAANPSASVKPDLNSCLFGTWKGVSDEYTFPIDSGTGPVMHGTGPMQIFRTNGVTITRYLRSEPDTGQSDGVTWKIAQNGSATATYTTGDGMVYESDLRKMSGTFTVYRNGAYDYSGDNNWVTTAYPYTCTAKTLTMFGQNNWTETLTRETSPAASSPGVTGKPKPSSAPSGS
jgi:hypothetical protein